MFWSKIWIFLVTVAAGVAIVVALSLPRPAGRRVREAEDMRLARARQDVERLLMIGARSQVDTAFAYGRTDLHGELRRLRDGSAESIPADVHDNVAKILGKAVEQTGNLKPDFVIALDAWGRVVARFGPDDKDWGDDLSGWFLVRDALRGYMRDDMWLLNGKLYRVAGAPVLARPLESGDRSYLGAVIVGDAVDESLARELEKLISSAPCPDGGCDTHVAFFARGETLANSGLQTLSGDIKNAVTARKAELEAKEADGRRKPMPALSIEGEGGTYRVVVRPLPGEVGAQEGFYAVYARSPDTAGFMGSLKSLAKQDLSFQTFPWILVGSAFLLLLLAGLTLTWFEIDRPLRRLLNEALALGKGDTRQFTEDQHHGKFGSIARSVNLALDKLNREVTAARVDAAEETAKELPATGPLGVPVSALPAPAVSDFSLDPPPPPANFGFGMPPPPSGIVPPAVTPRSSRPSVEDLLPPPRPAAPPPRPAAPPPPVPRQPLSALDDDILNPPTPPPAAVPGEISSEPSRALIAQQATPEGEASYFRQVYEDFVELKRKCGESTDGLTYDKFSVKLRQNRDTLVQKYACKAVKFQVYVKDGKAALKATPVRS